MVLETTLKCFSCGGDTDVDTECNIVCIVCAKHQRSIFDLFHDPPGGKVDEFAIQEWQRGRDVRCSRCSSLRLYEDSQQGNVVCNDCGTVNAENLIFDGADWSNYESTRESGKDNSRVGWRDDSNPYNTLGSSIKSGKYSFIKVRNAEGKWVTRDLSKVNQICSANSKEKSFYEVIKKLDSLTYDDEFNKRTVDKAKVFWNEIFKKERIFRGGNRNGIIACCVLYACYDINVPVDREKVARNMYISTDDIVKGEPIFQSIIQETRFRDVLQKTPNITCNFMAIIDNLGLPFNVCAKCNEIFARCEEDLSEIGFKSATGGVIAYVVTYVLKQKKPSKKEIAEKVGVSVPTITNSMKIIRNLLL